MSNINRGDLDDFRVKHFAVEVTPKQRDYDDDFRIAITHNGYQWQAIGLSREEMPKVIAAMQAALKP